MNPSDAKETTKQAKNALLNAVLAKEEIKFSLLSWKVRMRLSSPHDIIIVPLIRSFVNLLAANRGCFRFFVDRYKGIRANPFIRLSNAEALLP